MYKLIINLKAYKEGFDKNSLKLAKAIEELKPVAKKLNVDIILVPTFLDLKEIKRNFKISVYSQSLDNFEYGAHTGFIVPEMIKDLKLKGSLINHSEHRLKFDEIKELVKKLNSLSLESCVCVRNDKEIEKIKKLKPTYIAVEPKELIGGDISISKAKPNLIIKSVKASGKIPLLVGAGVKNKEDVKKAVELGAKGILVASGVVKARNKKKTILDLLEGFN